MSQSKGLVTLTHHRAKYMYRPVVDDVCRRMAGSSCVLTQTNEEAVIVLALLHKKGVSAKLIQSLDGLRFWNVAEMRYFMKCIDDGIGSPVIDDVLWETAKRKTCAKYAASKALPYIRRCVETFESTNRAKYYSDFREFVFESSVEDFCDVSGADVVVSTIHKAKGWEFDNVYMLVSAQYAPTDDLMRRYYVAMTRARLSLSVHTNGGAFDRMCVDSRMEDACDYSMPEEIVLQLSYKDVNLGFFKDCKHEVLALQSGAPLAYYDHYLCNVANGRAIGKLSQSMQEKLAKWEAKGYKVVSATVRFVVAWKPKDAPKNEKETAVLLADLTLRVGE